MSFPTLSRSLCFPPAWTHFWEWGGWLPTSPSNTHSRVDPALHEAPLSFHGSSSSTVMNNINSVWQFCDQLNSESIHSKFKNAILLHSLQVWILLCVPIKGWVCQRCVVIWLINLHVRFVSQSAWTNLPMSLPGSTVPWKMGLNCRRVRGRRKERWRVGKREGRGTKKKKKKKCRLLRGQLNAGPQIRNCSNGEHVSEDYSGESAKMITPMTESFTVLREWTAVWSLDWHKITTIHWPCPII